MAKSKPKSRVMWVVWLGSSYPQEIGYTRKQAIFNLMYTVNGMSGKRTWEDMMKGGYTVSKATITHAAPAHDGKGVGQ